MSIYDSIAFLVFPVLITALLVLLVCFFQQKKLKRLKQELLRTRVTSKFAKARAELMKAMARGEIDSQSDFFRTLYYVNTYVMRRPEQHHQIAKVMTESLLRSSDFQEQAGKIPNHDSARKVLRLTSSAIQDLMFSYSFFIRFATALSKLFTPVRKSTHTIVQFAEEYESKHSPDMKTYIKSKEVLSKAEQQLELVPA